MSMGDYSVAVKISLINHVSSGLVSMAQQFAKLNNQAVMFQARINSLRFQGRVGAGMIDFGSAMLAPFLKAATQAGKLEQHLFVIKTATQANIEQMDNYRKAIERVASQSMFSSIKVAEMGKIIATTGNFKIDQLAKVTEEFTKFATIQNIIKGTSFEASTKQGLQLSEITGHFDAASTKKNLDLLTKIGLIMPDSIQQVLGSMKYMQGTVKNVMGVEDEQGLLFVAMLNRLGINGTRAGSMLTAAISRSVPGVLGSGLWDGKSPQALNAMGMTDGAGHANYFNKQGKFDAIKWMSLMGDYVKKEFALNSPGVARENIMKNFSYAYGMNGARIAGLLSSPEALEQYKVLERVVKMYPNLDKLSEGMDTLFVKQLPQAMENFQTALVNIGYTLLPIASNALKSFNENAESLIKFMQAHETAIRIFAQSFLWIGGLAVLGGSLLLIKVGLMGLIIPITLISAPIWLSVAALTAFGFALYQLVNNWNQIKAALVDTKIFYYAERAFYYLGATVYHLLHPVEALQQAFSFLFETIAGWVRKVGNFISSPFSSENNNSVSLYRNNGSVGNLSNESPYVRSNPQFRVATPGDSKSKGDLQPIHVNLNVDGQKMASVVAKHIYNQATNMPNTTSLFDTALSPMPTIVNAIGIS